LDIIIITTNIVIGIAIEGPFNIEAAGRIVGTAVMELKRIKMLTYSVNTARNCYTTNP
jgi:hypothetical protein